MSEPDAPMRPVRHRIMLTTSFPLDDSDYAGHFVRAEAEGYVEAGERVTVLAPDRPQILDADLPCRIVRLGAGTAFGPPGAFHRLKENPVRFVSLAGFVARARRWLRHCPDFDVIEGHWLLPCGFPILTPNRVDVPVELVAHGSDVELLLTLPNWFLKQLARRWQLQGIHLRFVAEHLRQKLKVALPRDLGDALMERSSVRAAALPFSADILERLQRSKRGNINGNAPESVVIVGRLVPSKNVDFALDALDGAVELSAEGAARLSVVVIGDGPERPTLERRFPQVRFLGALPRTETLEEIARATALVSASEHEGAPTAIREALALGTPVISRPVGDLAQLNRSDVILFNTQSELRERLSQLLTRAT